MRARFAFRYLLDYAGLFSNREAGTLCIHYGNRLVHYSGFTPRYWRFPFLADQDLQIGDTWTDPAHRGKGLAGYALEEIMEIKQAPGRGFWYVVEDKNAPSIRVVERAGFELLGIGTWRKPWGIKLLGSYFIDAGGRVSRPAAAEALVETVAAPNAEPAMTAAYIADSMPKRSADHVDASVGVVK
jgi:GNAT superfamily N-acetyltransferase